MDEDVLNASSPRAEREADARRVAMMVFLGSGNHLEVLQRLRNQEDPFPLDESTCAAAARGGHLEVLKWLRSQDDPCPWDEETCYCAALGGHLEVLHWLRSQEDPCPWDESICGTAFCDWLCLNPISAQAVLESN